MNFFELLYKRILVIEKERGYSSTQKVIELKILEVSPSGKWVKIQNIDGHKYWRAAADIIPIEILGQKDSPDMPTEPT